MDSVQLCSNDGSCVTWVWVGELDAADCAGLARVWTSLMGDDTVHVVIDTTAVTFVDCAVLSFLVQARAQRGPRLSLHLVPGPLTRLFAMTGLTGFMATGEPTVPRARVC